MICSFHADINAAEPIQQLTHEMNSYQQYLKYKYKALELISPDEMLDCSSTEYIDLTLITSTTGTQESISEILNVQHNEKNIVLIEGAPGIGKSTLAISICKCWAEGRLLQAYHAVILLPLREKEIQDAKEVNDLLLILDDQTRREVFKEMIRKNGERICFIYEGFDELPTHLRKSSMFIEIHKWLPMSTLVYTARPEACSKLRAIATKNVTIKGFSKESVDKYILKTFDNDQEKADNLKVQINSKPWIKKILHIPINVAIVCLIFFHSESSVLPDTLTELYNVLILRLILRHLKIRTPNVAEIEILKSLNDLPAEFSDQFSQLCHIAIMGVLNRKIIFSSEDLQEMGIADKTINGMGLLLIAPRVLVYGREKSYNFLHLTLQEFCAAWHLSKLPIERQIYIVKALCDIGYLEMMFLFYSGITGLRNREVLNSLLPYKQLKTEVTMRQASNILKFLYEAHDSDACQIVGDHLDGNVHLFYYDATTPTIISDLMHVIKYFITEYKGKLALINMARPAFVVENDLALLANYLVKRRELQCNNDGVVLKLSFLVLPENASKFIFLAVKSYSITEICIDTVTLQGKLSLQFLLQLLCFNNALTVLNINNIIISLEGELDFSNCSNISLRKLIITRSDLIPVVDEIGKLLSFCKSISFANFSCNELGDPEIEKLVQHLKSDSTLQYLDLSCNNITVVGINHLKGLIATNPLTLTSIELSNNPLKDEGVHLLLQMLTVPMEHIGLNCVEMTSSSCQYVANALHQIKSISLTVPDEPEVIGVGIAESNMLESVSLNITNYDIHSKIMSGIKQTISIKELALHYNNCDADKCVEDLCLFIKDNKSVTELSIDCSTASPQILLAVVDSLATNASIKQFDFNLIYELDTFNHKDIKEVVLQFLKRLSPVSILEYIALDVHGDYYSEYDPVTIDELKINVDYDYHQEIEQCVRQINETRNTQDIVKPLTASIYLS